MIGNIVAVTRVVLQEERSSNNVECSQGFHL